jgi:hypothetical protein
METGLDPFQESHEIEKAREIRGVRSTQVFSPSFDQSLPLADENETA